MNRRQSLTSARAFLGKDSEIDVIARLVPLHHNPNNWKIWADDKNNKFTLEKDKITLKLVKEDNLKTTDIYYQAQPHYIAQISNHIFYIKLNKNDLLCFVGKDFRLRCAIFKNNIWVKNISPSLLGFELLQFIARYKSKTYKTSWKKLKLYNQTYENIVIHSLPLTKENIELIDCSNKIKKALRNDKK